MPKKYKLVVTDPDQVDNIVEHEIGEMEAEALIAQNTGASADDANMASASEDKSGANEDKAFSDQMLDATREPTFEEVKRKKLGY